MGVHRFGQGIPVAAATGREPLFIRSGEVNFIGAAGHYNKDGNSYIAKILYDKLLGIPRIAEKLK